MIKPGLYEQIIDLVLSRRMKAGKDDYDFITKNLDSAESHELLSQYLHRILAQGLSQVMPPASGSDKERKRIRLQKQIAVCNEIVSVLQTSGLADGEQSISPEAKRLMQVLEKAAVKSTAPDVQRPDTPLALGSLLTGTRQDPSLVSQLQKEILHADRVDILCSFIKWTGIRILAEALNTFCHRNGSKLRVLTTSYMGATDFKAVEYVAGLPNTEVKVSYDTKRTRLHAKAYLIHRETGFSSAYVGSANISQAALTDGLEWTIKISQYEQPFQWDKISATFETYWNDNEFESFKPEDEEKLKKALIKERTKDLKEDFTLPNFNLRPYGFQQEILDRIEAERQLQRRKKHLIVAATGTGKTMIAAFHFQHWRQQRFARNIKEEPRFLFVAHREEILKQSLYTFRAVLRDQNYGDLMVGGQHPSQLEQLFISIQTFNSQNLAQFVDAGHYDYVVIDEFHHAAAKSYGDLLEHLKPDCLLGMTATPERADGRDVREYFDGHITAEIRLPDAINRKLLCPFQYFGLTDSEDYSGLTWRQGGYVHSELENLLTGNDIRVQLVIQKLHEIILDVRKVRGLGFCVSKAHAEFMSRKFNESGIPSAFLTADSSTEHRRTVQHRLVARDINFIFTVDLYNEGVDIPQVDTVLFLRPTESLTVFLQQLGRGLRLYDEKDCLTVLDFVGQAHKKYRFDMKFEALLSSRRLRVQDEIKEGFPHLPAGCSVQLERQATHYILENIKRALSQSKPRIIGAIQSFSQDTGLPLTMANFLDYHRLEVDDIYRKGSWSQLCVQAGVRPDIKDPDKLQLAKGLRRIAHVNDLDLIDRVSELIGLKVVSIADTNEMDRRRLLMLHFSLLGNDPPPASYTDVMDRLGQNPTLCQELKDLLSIRRDSMASVPPTLQLAFECPLQLHAQYTRDEILAALGYWTLERHPSMREGVVHIPAEKIDAFFITLNKSEKQYSPTTMYEDYAINETLFHWQSQSTTSADGPTGQRYINHEKKGYSILLFVREDKKRHNLSEPYYFLGPAKYVSHKGSRPISFVFRLEHPMPSFLQLKTKRLVAV